MSTFKGLLNEYPNIAIDYFKSRTLDVVISAYFLSHCHKDHMEGLSSVEFSQKLDSNRRIKLYTSEVTKCLLLNDEHYRHLEPYLEVLPLDHPTIISLQSLLSAKETEIVVTLLPAGHCPGSVMFLLEGAEGTVLYTGDFRFSVGDVQKIHLLQESNQKPKAVRSLYIDTTFCRMEASYIPSRSESLEAVVSLVSPWLSQSSNHFVRLICSAQYGYEYIFIALAKKYNMKVHVNESQMKKYRGIAEIEEAVTSNPLETKIHACRWSADDPDVNLPGKSRLPCEQGVENGISKKSRVLLIKLSAMWYARYVSIQETSVKCGSDFYRVCFSTHSSLSELQDVVNYLKPEKVHPNVVPKDMTPDQVVKWLLPCKLNGTLPNSSVYIPQQNHTENGDAPSESNSVIDDCEEILSSQQTDITSSHGSRNWKESESELDLSGEEAEKESEGDACPRPDSGDGPKWHYEVSPSKTSSGACITSSDEPNRSFKNGIAATNADSTDRVSLPGKLKDVGDSTSNLSEGNARDESLSNHSKDSPKKSNADDAITSCSSDRNADAFFAENCNYAIGGIDTSVREVKNGSSSSSTSTSCSGVEDNAANDSLAPLDESAALEELEGKTRKRLSDESGSPSQHPKKNCTSPDLEIQSPSSSDLSCCVTSTDVIYASAIVSNPERTKVRIMDCDTSTSSDDLFSDDSSIVECDGSSDAETKKMEVLESGGSSPDILCICDSSSVIRTQAESHLPSAIEVVNVDDDVTSPTDVDETGNNWASTSEDKCGEAEKVVVNGHCKNLSGDDSEECTSTADIEVITIDD